MNFTKEEIEARIKELDAAIMQQGQYVQQMNNQILMMHGAKEEWNVCLKKMAEKEKMEAEAKAKAEANGAVQDDCVKEAVNE
jgi:uncharacterized coiled-coil protein SlyX